MLLLALLLVAGCGGGSSEDDETGRAPSSPSTPAATSEDGDGPLGRDPERPEEERSIPPPVPGDYVYGLDGTTASYTDEVSVTERSRGDRVRVDSRSDRSASRTTSLLSWRQDGVFMELRRIAVSDDLVFECTFDPQIPLLRFPLERADYPRVEWETEACSGSIDVNVVERGELAAANRSWRVWHVETNLNLMMRSGEHEFTIDYEEKSWWAPELRKEVKRDRRSAGNLDGYRTSDRVVPVLQSYPRVSG